jgi:hypothetical protein
MQRQQNMIEGPLHVRGRRWQHGDFIDDLLSERAQFDLGLLGAPSQHTKRLIRADPVNGHQHAFGLPRSPHGLRTGPAALRRGPPCGFQRRCWSGRRNVRRFPRPLRSPEPEGTHAVVAGLELRLRQRFKGHVHVNDHSIVYITCPPVRQDRQTSVVRPPYCLTALAWTSDHAGAHAQCAERTARGRRPYEPDRVMPT